MNNATVTELCIFPIKGCQGIQVDSIQIDKTGIKGDRDFSFWANEKVIDQKCTPKLATISASVNEDQTVLTLKHDTHGEFELEINRNGKKLKVTQVLDKYEAVDQGDAVAEWASKIVGKDIRLVGAGDSWKINLPIPVLKEMHNQDKNKFFAVSSVSMVNTASLVEFNKMIEAPVEVDRFRSNIVLDGLEAWDEDVMGALYSDNVELKHLSAAERCVIITTDQTTGERPKNNMLQTLKERRLRPREDRFASGLLFGEYMSVIKDGVLKVGDTLVHRPDAAKEQSVSTETASVVASNNKSEKNADLDGSWEFSISGTPIGDQRLKVQFTTGGEKITGEVSNSDIAEATTKIEKAELEECTLAGNSLNFVIDLIEPIEIPLIGSFDITDDKMSGSIKLGALGEFAATATRAG